MSNEKKFKPKVKINEQLIELTKFMNEIMGGDLDIDIVRLQCGLCPQCGNDIDGFRDMFSLKEFEVSGLCQECQDRIFDLKIEN